MRIIFLFIFYLGFFLSSVGLNGEKPTSVSDCHNVEKTTSLQSSKVVDECVAGPILNCVDIEITPFKDYGTFSRNCIGNVKLQASGGTAGDCGSNNILRWEVFFDAFSDGIVDRIASSSLLGQPEYEWKKVMKYAGANINSEWMEVQNEYPNHVFADSIYVLYLSPTNRPFPIVSLPYFQLRAGDVPHLVNWHIYNECNGSTTCSSNVTVKDFQAPIPYCVHGEDLYVSQIEEKLKVFAADFNRGAYDNCSEDEEISVTFDGVPPILSQLNQNHYFKDQNGVSVVATSTEFNAGLAYEWIPDRKCSAKMFGIGSANIQIDFWDEQWNTDFCDVLIRVFCDCPSGEQVVMSGIVTTPAGKPVPEVNVTFYSLQTEYPLVDTTGGSGMFFSTHALFRDYQIVPSKNDYYNNGVNTLDLVFIQRHILFLQRFDEDYKWIAADANNDGNISVADLSEFRKVILGISPTFVNKSWRFVTKNGHVNLVNLTFPESYMEEDVDGDRKDLDFTAVKIGDVTGDVDTGFEGIVETETRIDSDFIMKIEDAFVDENELVRLPIIAGNDISFYGFQGTLMMPGLEFVNIEVGNLNITEDEIGVIGQDKLTFSFSRPQVLYAEAGDILFTLVLKAKFPINIGDVAQMTSDITASEYYDHHFNTGRLKLEIIENIEADLLPQILYQNIPNPFDEGTQIMFRLNSNRTATLRVFDVTGKLIWNKEINGIAGLNRVDINRNELVSTSGFLFYSIESGDFTDFKKMVIFK